MSDEPKVDLSPKSFDFVNMTKSADEIVRLMILGRRFDVIEALECYDKNVQLYGNDGRDSTFVVARLKTLFRELRPLLKRKWSEEVFKGFESKVRGLTLDHEDEFVELADVFIDFIDELGLTRVDTFNPKSKKIMEER